LPKLAVIMASWDAAMGMQQTDSGVRHKLDHLRYLYRHGGVGGVLFFLIYKLVNHFTRLLVFRVAIIEPPELVAAHLGHLGAYRHGFCSAAELAPFVDDPENDLSREFIEYATAQGDSCYAIFDGDLLVSYCWNSDKPTRIEHDLYMGFRNGYLYRYKEYTRPSHRGRRLGSYGQAESLRLFAASGVKGCAGYVEANNCIQYRMLQRMNHRFPGFIVMLGRGPTPWIWYSPGARAWGFQVYSITPGMPRHCVLLG
jgi:hypothetical protein